MPAGLKLCDSRSVLNNSSSKENWRDLSSAITIKVSTGFCILQHFIIELNEEVEGMIVKCSEDTNLVEQSIPWNTEIKLKMIVISLKNGLKVKTKHVKDNCKVLYVGNKCLV